MIINKRTNFSLNSALDKLRERVPLQPYLGHMSILDQGHSTKLSKIETLRLAQNYIKLLAYFLATNQRIPIEDIHHILSGNLSQATANLLRSRLIYDWDYSIARNVIDDGHEMEDTRTSQDHIGGGNGHKCMDIQWSEIEDHTSYSDYLDVDPYLSSCYFK